MAIHPCSGVYLSPPPDRNRSRLDNNSLSSESTHAPAGDAQDHFCYPTRERIELPAAEEPMPTSETPTPMPTAVRSAGRPRDRRAHHKILEATRSLATEQGYGGVTIEGVARAAGVAKTTIYRWWSSKSALVYEACFDPELRDPLPDTGSLQGDLEALVRQEVERQTGDVASRVLPGLIAEQAQAQANGKASILDPILRPERRRAGAVLERASRRGDIKQADGGDLLFDQVAGAVFHRTFVAGNPADTQFQADLARVLLSGLKG